MSVILCAIDDLIFSIKISTAAKGLGADVFFERSGEAVLPRIREKRPALVILDLNSRRIESIGIVTAMKADDELKAIRTLGYVSHVDADTIAAARAAGIDQVLARSAFVARLAEILTSG
jgi:CheY-like chemotaxis protein